MSSESIAGFLPAVGYGVVARIIDEIDVPGASHIWVFANGDEKRLRWNQDNLAVSASMKGVNELDITGSRRDSLVTTGLGNEMMYVGFHLKYEENVGAIEACSRYDGFTFGAVGDGKDAMWQGEDQPSNFELDSLAVPDLPRVFDSRGRERLDVSGNVGRWFDTFGARLWAGSRMWFGRAFDPVISLDRVRSLPVGELSDGPHGGIQVRLFEPGDPLEVVRERQRVVVEWLGFRWLEEHTEQIRAAYPDRFTG